MRPYGQSLPVERGRMSGYIRGRSDMPGLGNLLRKEDGTPRTDSKHVVVFEQHDIILWILLNMRRVVQVHMLGSPPGVVQSSQSRQVYPES